MDRAFSSGASASAPTAPASPSIGYATAGNPGTGTPATKPGPYWYHMMTEEQRAVIVAAGLTPDQNNLTQLSDAIAVAVRLQAAAHASAGGTADALIGVYAPAVPALVNGLTLYVRAASSNTTTAPTFSPNGLAAKQIVKGNNLPLVAGDIAGAGHWIELQYDATLAKWILLNPATGVSLLPLFGASLAGTGWQKLPSGLIIQWGNVAITTIASLYSFPFAFPTGSYQVVISPINSLGAACAAAATSATQFTAVASAGTPGCSYIAFGK